MIDHLSIYRYGDFEADLWNIVQSYADCIEMKVLGFSVMQRPLYSLTLGKGKKRIQISGSHHAREWISSWLALRLLQKYADDYSNHSEIGELSIRELLDEISLQFIPMVNPDGVVLATEGWEAAGLSYHHYREMADVNQIGDAYWLWKANLRGVDLNRQYDMNWEWIQNSPLTPAAMNYKGEKPANEPEVLALLHDVTESPPVMVIAYHSAGEEIFWYHGQEGCIRERDLEIARSLACLTGYTLVPEEEFIAGGFADWFVYTYCRPGFTVELGKEPHPVGLRQADRIWRQNQYLPLIAVRESLKL